MPIGVVSGFQREIQCLVATSPMSPDVLTFAGFGPERGEAGAYQLIAKGADALVSFGIAGGIAPGVQAGMLVLASTVIDGEKKFKASDVWRNSLKKLLPSDINVSEGSIVGVDKMVASQDAKRQLFEATGAIACDMETHSMARVAVATGVPFIVVRAISDPAWRDIPNWILSCLTSDGEVDYWRLSLAQLSHPWRLPALMVLAGNSKKAFVSLRRVAGVAGSSLGFMGGL